MLTESLIRQALTQVKYPGYSRDIVSFGFIKGIAINQGQVTIYMSIDSANDSLINMLKNQVLEVVKALPDVLHVTVDIIKKEATSGVERGPLPGVSRIIAIASGKGGVGKSTVTANLAIALAKQGLKVGLLDCDLYGPSMGLMFGNQTAQVFVNEKEEIIPILAHGIKLLSMGFLLDENSPIVVRGPVATKYIQQFLRQVEWGELDILLLDLPPGTGDIQLTIVQTVPLQGAIIVSTPQEMALIDARKAIAMFDKVQVPILGLVENMSYFLCPSDSIKYPIFGEGGTKYEAEQRGLPLLAELPLDMETRIRADQGTPIALEDPQLNIISAHFYQMALNIRHILSC